MNPLKKMFGSIATLPPRQAVAILLPAFRRADCDEMPALAELLLLTERPEAIRAVIRRWHLIPPPERPRVTRFTVIDRAGFDLAIQRADESLLGNAVDFLRDARDPSLAPALAAVIERNTFDLRDAAGRTLLDLAASVARSEPQSSQAHAAHASKRDVMDATVARLMDGYRLHRCRDVLLAAALLAHNPGPRLRAILATDDHAGTIALRSIPARLDSRLVRANIIRWLGVDVLQRPTLRRLDEIETAEQWDDVLAEGHLLLSPVRRRAMRRHPKPRTILPELAHAARMSERSQSNSVDWVRGSGLSTPARVQALHDLIALPSPLARLKAAWAIGNLAAAGADDAAHALASFTRDSDPDVARLAVRMRHAVSGETQFLIGTPDGRLDCRSHAGRNLIDHWDALSEQQRLLIAFRVAANDVADLTAALRELLMKNERQTSIDALRLIGRLRLASVMQDEVLAATESGDVHVAATAVAVVGEIEHGQHDCRVIERRAALLKHPNPRVRANAVEAITRQSAGEEVIQPCVAIDLPGLATSSENRLRANAIRAMLLHDVSTAIDYWRSMLTDQRPLHRISAIWLAMRSPYRDMREDLEGLAAFEPMAEVRVRAMAAARWVQRFPVPPRSACKSHPSVETVEP